MFDNHFRFEASFDGLWKHEKKTFRPIFIATFVSFILLILYFIVMASFDLAYIKVAGQAFEGKPTKRIFAWLYEKYALILNNI